MATKSNKTPDFEKALGELEEIVERLEEGELSLEESLKQFEQGIQLTRHCRDALEKAEQRVRKLAGDGEDAGLEDFEAGEARNDSADASDT